MWSRKLSQPRYFAWFDLPQPIDLRLFSELAHDHPNKQFSGLHDVIHQHGLDLELDVVETIVLPVVLPVVLAGAGQLLTMLAPISRIEPSQVSSARLHAELSSHRFRPRTSSLSFIAPSGFAPLQPPAATYLGACTISCYDVH